MLASYIDFFIFVFFISPLFNQASAIAVPGGDTARQDALNCASVKVCEGFR
jgi:hypothetical protein